MHKRLALCKYIPEEEMTMSDFLIHSAKGTTWTKNNHKWIRRKKGPKGTWQYFYDYQLTGKGYKYDAQKYQEAAKEMERQKRRAKSDGNWEIDNGDLKKSLSFNEKYTEYGKYYNLGITDTRRVGEGSARREKEFDAKASASLARYEKYSLAGKSKKIIEKGKDYIKRLFG